jgi:hypothetical protein
MKEQLNAAQLCATPFIGHGISPRKWLTICRRSHKWSSQLASRGQQSVAAIECSGTCWCLPGYFIEAITCTLIEISAIHTISFGVAPIVSSRGHRKFSVILNGLNRDKDQFTQDAVDEGLVIFKEAKTAGSVWLKQGPIQPPTFRLKTSC